MHSMCSQTISATFRSRPNIQKKTAVSQYRALFSPSTYLRWTTIYTLPDRSSPNTKWPIPNTCQDNRLACSLPSILGSPTPTYHKYIHLLTPNQLFLTTIKSKPACVNGMFATLLFKFIVKLKCLDHIFLAIWWTCFTRPRHTYPDNISRHFRISRECQEHTLACPL